MSSASVRLRTHQHNIDRYESLLKGKLTDAERLLFEKHLSEERLVVAMLQFMAPPHAAPKGYDLPNASEWTG